MALSLQMTLQHYIIPIFVSSNLFGQTNPEIFPEVEFGFSHSVFTSMSFQTTKPNPLIKEQHRNDRKSGVTETQYGFGIGFFLWMPLNKGVTFKPKLEGAFSTNCLKQAPAIFATAFDVSIYNGFAIALKMPDNHGIIYLAREMSCYLTSKQPYLLIGPKIGLRKFDNGYLDKGFQNELAFGFTAGYGISYEFHGTKFAPEISYTITSTAQNKINDSKKVMHSLTFAVNFF